LSSNGSRASGLDHTRKPTPSTPKHQNAAWEGVSRIFWGYLDPKKFTKGTVPDADGFNGSKGHQHFIGLCPERGKAEREGPLRASFLPCSCDACLVIDFASCSMLSQVGTMGHQKTRLAKGSKAAPQLKELEEFGKLLKKGMLVAMRADEQDLWMEGKFWLALVEGEAFPAPADMAVATDVFEEGYLIVPIRWYELVDTERRGYKLHTEVHHIVVNAMVFLDGLQFEGGQGGPQGRNLRAAPRRLDGSSRPDTGLSFLGLETTNYILDSF